MMLQCGGCIRDFDANGLVQLTGYPVPPYVLITKSKIETLADMRGRKMRSGGGSFSAWAKSVGAIDVNIPVDEMFEAFNAGVIDVGVQTQNGLRSYNFWDVAKHVTELPVGIISAAALFTAGKKMWKDLTPIERSAMLDAAVAGTIAQVEAYDAEVREIYGPARQRGVTFTQPAADLIKATEDFRRSVAEEVAKASPEKYGNVDVQGLVKTYLGLLAKWDGLVKPVRENYPALAALLQREIYDRVDRASWGM
jgi:TRAP-type C4-dicarboxylate transport system substrate-binding protein